MDLRILLITIKALLDICTHRIARAGWGLPKAHVESTEMAVYHGLMPNVFFDIYKAMDYFRNGVVHMDKALTTEEIHRIIKNHLDDLQPFLENVIKIYLKV